MVVTSGCKRLSVRIEDEDGVRVIPVPFSLLGMALRYSDDDVSFDLNELSGSETQIDLRAMALALRDAGDKIAIDGRTEDGMTFSARIKGKSFCVDMDNPEEEEHIIMNLPLDVITQLADADGQVPAERLLRSFKGWRGVLVEVVGPYESIRIAVR
jgi:translation initiation factor IF-1